MRPRRLPSRRWRALAALLLVAVGVVLYVLGDWSAGPKHRAAAPTTQSAVATGTPRPLVFVPELLGLDHDQAYAAITHARFTFGARYIANNSVPAGRVASQYPTGGTRVPATSAIQVTFSTGGPAVAFEELPQIAKAQARAFAGYDETEPVLIARTAKGVAYKTDFYLFGPCAAVELAYRTFSDPSYGDDCY